MSAAAQTDTGPRDQVNAVDLAAALVANRRVAIGLPIDQIRDLAAALLIYDQQLEDANRRMAAMMLAEDQPPAPKPEVKPQPKPVHVPIVAGGNAQLTAALEGLVEARWHLEQERHSAGENLARQKFEKAAVAVCNQVTPKKRT